MYTKGRLSLKLSFNWLNDFADFRSVPFNRILEKISLSICEVDEVEEYRVFLEKVITVRIESLEKHPDANNLSVCNVTDGSKSYTVVTNSKNVSVGDVVPLATPGAVIAGKKIESAPVRGVNSYGMFVSAKDMELSEENSGVHVFPSNTLIGTNIRKLMDWEDAIFHVDNKSITHRPDLWSHFGFARELAAQLNIPIRYNPFDSNYSNFQKEKKLTVNHSDYAHSYYASYISNIKIAPSNSQISSRLVRCGVKSINNVVDVSNYVMLEMGQPTHFFDSNSLSEIIIDVSYSRQGESLKILDSTNLSLIDNVVLIRNKSVPIALAGVMGGLESGVTDSTTSVVLESAVFKREDIRKAIRFSGIRSEASIRYEKGLDSSYSLPVLNRTIELLQKNGNPDLVAYFPEGFNNNAAKAVKIETDLDFINQKLGKELKPEQIVEILERLHFSVKQKDKHFSIIAPKFRHNYDITIPEDIVEEIGRTLEYSNIPNKPLSWEVKPVPKNYKLELERKLRRLFANSLGYSEVYNYSFASQRDNSFEGKPEDSVALQNTMPEDQKYLRTSIYPSILKNLSSNLDRFDIIQIFEYGRTYHKSQNKELTNEKRWFSFGVSKNRKVNELLEVLESDLLSVRKNIENVLVALNITNYSVERSKAKYLHPGASIQFVYKTEVLAELGYLHPSWNDSFDIKKKVIIGRLDFDALLQAYTESIFVTKFRAPSQFPQDRVDVSLIMEDKETTESYSKLIMNAKIPEVDSVWVLDVYKGENIGVGKKSVTYRAYLLTYEKTFTSERIKEINEKLLQIAKENKFTIKGSV